jgi:hypothetical protein
LECPLKGSCDARNEDVIDVRNDFVGFSCREALDKLLEERALAFYRSLPKQVCQFGTIAEARPAAYFRFSEESIRADPVSSDPSGIAEHVKL